MRLQPASPTAPTWAPWSGSASWTRSPRTSRTPSPRAPGARRRPRPARHRPLLLRADLLDGVTPDMAVCGEETFGPVVSVYRFARRGRGGRARQRRRTASTPRSGPRTAAAAARSRRRASGTVNVNEGYAAAYGSIDAPMGGMRIRPRPPPRLRGHPQVHRGADGRHPAAAADSAPMFGLSDEQYAELMTARCGCSRSLGRAMSQHDYDVMVVGSGFGGSVTALRLTEKGYRVGVLEAGRRFADDDFAEDLLGPQALPLGAAARLLRHPAHPPAQATCMVLAGAGVGGGSLIYANTLYEPLAAVLRRPAVGAHHRLAGASSRRTTTRPSGCSASSTNPTMTPADDVMEQVAEEMGVGDTFHLTPGRRLLRAAGRDPGRDGRRPVLRRRRARRAPAASSAASA